VRRYVAEALATFALVFAGTAAIVVDDLSGGVVTHVGVALTFGLEDDPVAAMQKMVAFVEERGREAGEEHPLQMTLGVSDGETLYAVRYSSEGDSRTLFYSTEMAQLRVLYGNLAIRSLMLDFADDEEDVLVYLQETPVSCHRVGQAVNFETDISIAAGEVLQIVARIDSHQKELR